MLPKLSPYVLLQESLWPDEWFILVSCVMLNQTSRKQVEKVLPLFMQKWPTAASLDQASQADIAETIKCLGFKTRRAATLKKLAHAYVMDNWYHASELPGIGIYGARAWEMFCCGLLSVDEPDDGALRAYWKWRQLTDVQANS